MRFQFKKTLPVEHSSEHFCCVGTHFQAFMNLSDVFFLRCFSEARKKHFRRNFRKCSRMRPIDCRLSACNVVLKPYVNWLIKEQLYSGPNKWFMGSLSSIFGRFWFDP